MKKINMKSLFRISGTVLGVLMVFALLPVIANAAGKVTVTSPSGVNIRSGAGTNSVIIASGLTNDTFDYLGSEKDSSGATWYKVQVDANTVGYIYAEYATTDGAAQTTTTTTTTTTQETPSQESTVATEVEPIVGTVTADVNVREGASTKHKIVTAAKTGSKVTILGYYDAADGYKWYNISYTSNTSSVNGYIRADFVKTESELVDKVDEPVVEDPVPEEPVVEEPVPPEPVKVYKDYEAVYDETEGVWYLENYIEGEKHKLTDLYDALDKVKAVENEAKAEIRKKKIVIGILSFVIVALLAAAVVVYILFRRWYFGYDDTEEAVNVKKPEKTVKRTPVVDDDEDDDDKDDDITLVRHTTSKVAAQTIEPKPATSTVMNKIPEGGKRLPDGRIQMPDGSIRRAVVGVKLADGSIRLPDGRIRKPDGTMIPAPQSIETPQTAPAPKAPVNMTLDDDDDDMELGFIGGNISSDLDEE